MLTYKQPILFCGENPAMTLYAPDGERVVAVASYWHCTYSSLGSGHALIVWVDPQHAPGWPHAGGSIFSDNLPLAHMLTETLAQHFDEFRGYNPAAFPYVAAQCRHHSDGQDAYEVLCTAGEDTITLRWSDVLSSTQVLWPRFPAGAQAFDLSTVICPCGAATISLNGQLLPGAAKTAQHDGRPTSSAFLAFAETWVGPVEAETTEPPAAELR